MIENYLGTRRSLPVHAPAQQHEAAENTAQNKDMQQGAPASGDVQHLAAPRPEEFTISVEQVREHFRKKGVQKSKDTVQRWCRTGELSCQKRGVLNRYFTTEASLKILEAKILPDMIAEAAGEATPLSDTVQGDAAARADLRSSVPPHAPADAAAYSGTKEHTSAEPQLHAAASSNTADVGIDLSRAMAENAGLRDQLKSKDSEIEFLREEVRAARDQRGAVVQISNRMLETLETIAIGGRLARPKGDAGGPPVRFPTQQSDTDAV